MKHRQHGFTLVELSIVLVILGLLVGGVLGGQSLIRAAELRSISTQYSQFNTAFNSFQDKYMGLPGDIVNATSFWPGTVNGNGNGYYDTCEGPPAPTPWSEQFRAWEQLGLAGLVEGQYTGTATVGAINCDGISLPGVNAPAGKITSTAWAVVALSQNSGVNYEMGYTDLPNIAYNWLIFGGVSTGAAFPIGAVLTPGEAWNIDQKLDDGKPGQGTMRAATGSSGSATACQSGNTSNSNYNLNLTSTLCAIGFVMN